MPSAMDALELAAYGLLTSGGGITGAVVYQHVPEDEQQNVVIIGDMDSEPLGGKDDDDCRISLTITAVTFGEERKPVLDLLDQVKTRLAKQQVTQSGWLLAIDFESDDAVLLPTGDGYVGTSCYSVIALAV